MFAKNFLTVVGKHDKIDVNFRKLILQLTLMRNIKYIGLSESRRVVRGGSEMFPTGLGVLCRKRMCVGMAGRLIPLQIDKVRRAYPYSCFAN